MGFSMLENYLILRYSFTKSHSLSMQTTHLSLKCNWCHVIDTVIQLYAIVGLGIRLKSMSVRSWNEVITNAFRFMEPGISRNSRDIQEFLDIPGQIHTVCTFSHAGLALAGAGPNARPGRRAQCMTQARAPLSSGFMTSSCSVNRVMIVVERRYKGPTRELSTFANVPVEICQLNQNQQF